MGQNLRDSLGESTRRSRASGPISVAIFVLSLLILGIEFSFDLTREIFWHRLLIYLDFAVIAIYFGFVVFKIIKNKSIILEFLSRKKFDVFHLFLVCLFLPLPRMAAVLVILRFFLSFLATTLESRLGEKFVSLLNLRPSQTMALSFIGLIATGTTLLTFPAATLNGKGTPVVDALFTITSASCVTGLSVFNLSEYFTFFGQVVILFAIQIGGLGIMVLSAAFAVLVGGMIPSRRQVGLNEVLDVSTPEALKSLIRAIATSTALAELIGALCLFPLWSAQDTPNLTARLWWSVFHSVSAFCNAGFGLSATSIAKYVNDPLVCLVLMALIVIGGIGFFVISDLSRREVWLVKKPRAMWSHLQIQTKVVLVTTIILNSLGTLLFLFFEYDNSLHGLGIDGKVLASLFQAVNLRTSGFSSVPLGDLAGPTIVFCTIFMFIGAAPGSTGGGIKVTTAAISFMSLRAMLRGRDEVEIFGRRIPGVIVGRSLSIVLVAAMIIAVFLTFLLATQDIKFEKLLYETLSAFGTVGLSMDVSPTLNTAGKLLIVLVMYIGRVGPLTLALAVGGRTLTKGFSLPSGRIAVG